MAKTTKKPTVTSKEEIKIEFTIRSSPKIIYNMLADPSGLSEWFCDDVNIKNGEYAFRWGDSIERAKLMGSKENGYVRFHWNDDEDEDTYFEWRIEMDDLTNDVALILTDFVDADEKQSRILFWNNQIHKLMHAVGS